MKTLNFLEISTFEKIGFLNTTAGILTDGANEMYISGFTGSYVIKSKGTTNFSPSFDCLLETPLYKAIAFKYWYDKFILESLSTLKNWLSDMLSTGIGCYDKHRVKAIKAAIKIKS